MSNAHLTKLIKNLYICFIVQNASLSISYVGY